jgi:pimeloyl-ACP methyl ester carboxylesterase
MVDPFEDFSYVSRDGLRLHARIYRPPRPDPVPVVCLPGLTRNARDFHELALHLAGAAKRPRLVIAFDYRGRGDSQRDPDPSHYTTVVEAADVIEGLARIEIARAAFIGTSRGGLILHLIAAQRPDLLACIVLNDVGPELGAAGLEHIKAYLGRPGTVRTFAEAVDLQRAIHGSHFPALSDSDWERMTRALYRDENGVPVPDYDPAIAGAFAALDTSVPLPTLWEQFDAFRTIPILAIRGTNSLLLTADILQRMRGAHAGLETVEVPGQGHPPLLDIAGLPDTIAAFIDRNS